MNRSLVILIALVAFAIPVFGQSAQPQSQTTAEAPYDLSSSIELLMAAEGGGGFTPGPQATAYAGVKLGGYVVGPPLIWSLDMGYDRLRGHNGFSIGATGLLPVFRYPGPQRDDRYWPKWSVADDRKNYFRIYAGPGIGYRTAGGGFGPYVSANVMVAFLSDKRLDFNSVSPYIEYQRRFPMMDLTRGDNRLTFGLLVALCNRCD